MKRHYFNYLIFLCLIISGCENAAYEQETFQTTASTRSNLEEVGYYGSNFQDQVFGTEEAFGYISLNPVGAEYSFSLATIVDKADIKSLVSIIGGSIIYNGRDLGSQINGVPGKIRFIVKFTSTMAKVTLTLKGAKPNDKSRSARLVIDERTYNGENLPLPTGDLLNSDLIVGQLP